MNPAHVIVIRRSRPSVTKFLNFAKRYFFLSGRLRATGYDNLPKNGKKHGEILQKNDPDSHIELNILQKKQWPMFKPTKEYKYIAITLLNLSYDELDVKLERLLFSDRMSYVWTSGKNNLTLNKVIENEQTEVSTKERRIVIWPYKKNDNRSIFLCNCVDGCQTIINSLKLPNDFIKIAVSSNTNAQPRNMFECQISNSKRYIQSYLDSDKWVFYERGDMLPFENPEYYKKRRIKDKLNYEIINEYLETSGWFLNEESFWKSYEATYFIEHHPNEIDDE